MASRTADGHPARNPIRMAANVIGPGGIAKTYPITKPKRTVENMFQSTKVDVLSLTHFYTGMHDVNLTHSRI
jgi:hypothetical protein